MRGFRGRTQTVIRLFIYLVIFTHFVSSLDIFVSKQEPEEGFEEVPDGVVTVDEGSSLHLQCLSSQHFSSNSSLLWTVKTEAWENSLWMNDSVMGLIEESNYAKDLMTSTLYIASAGAKDVGNYRCDQIDREIVEIDQDTTEHGIHVFVTGSSLTSVDTGQVILLDSSTSSPTILPCTPTHTSVTVKVTANGEEVTHLFKFDPRVGFTATSPLAVSSFTCYFSYQNRTESVHLKMLSTGLSPTSSPAILPVTLHIKEDQVEALDVIEIVCKVVTEKNDGVDIYWTIPGIKTHKLHTDDFTIMHSDKYSMEQMNMNGTIISTLLVLKLNKDNQGMYRCHADQVNGQSGEAEFHLNVDLVNLPPVLPFQARSLSTASSTPTWQCWHSPVIFIALVHVTFVFIK